MPPLLLVTVTLATFGLAKWHPFSPSAAPAASVAGDATRGREVFVVNCSGCHGMDATGGIGPSLLGSGLSAAEVAEIVASGRGAVVNIGGVSAHMGAARRAHVIAAKAGLTGLTRALAHDLAPHSVTVNCVVPGQIDTRRAWGKEPAHHSAQAPLVGRRGRPEEIAALVRFLCGPDARYITGQTLHANGGLYLG